MNFFYIFFTQDSCARSATIDATNAPDVAKLFLELASVVARIFILAARQEFHILTYVFFTFFDGNKNL